MNIKSFLKLVEIQTKVASVTPFIFGTIFSLYFFNAFDLKNFLFMFVSLLCIDMATTTINNYIDYKKAIRKHGYGYESHNAIVRDNLKESSVVITIFVLIVIAMLFGFLLYLNTNIIVLLLGGLSFIVGVLYSFGPFPISRTPFGEIFSGGIMGFIIPFLAVYIHIYDQNIIEIVYSSGHLNIDLSVSEILSILLVSVPFVSGIANIMLANNICDIDDDIENKRYTLPIYIGKKHALTVFRVIYYIGYIAIIIALILGILPLTSILALFTFILINKNINRFCQKQKKDETFVLSVQNFLLSNIVYIASIALGLLL